MILTYEVLDEIYKDSNKNISIGIKIHAVYVNYNKDDVKVKVFFSPYVTEGDNIIYQDYNQDDYQIVIIDKDNNVYKDLTLPKDFKDVYLIVVDKDYTRRSKVIKLG